MNGLRFGAALLIATLLVLACSGSSDSSDPNDSVPPACRVSASGSAPYSVSFNFTNASGQTLFMHQGCSLSFSVSACADDYQEPLKLSAPCTVECSDQDGCVQCGACANSGVEVTPTAPRKGEWQGKIYTLGTNRAGCSCHTSRVAPAAKYRITVPVYASESDATSRKPLREVVVDFELAAAGTQVEVPLDVAQPGP